MGQVLCVIPARGGSKRIPRKNIKEFYGKPIISYSIEAVINSGIADEVMVSTDDIEIAEVAKRYGANVPFYRDDETSDDKAGIADVLIEVIEQYKLMGKSFEYIVCVLATAPLVRSEDIRAAFNELKENGVADSICSVEVFSYPPQRGLVICDGFLKMKCPENYYARSQDLEKIYHDCGQFFIFKTDALLREKKLYTQNAIPYHIDGNASQDIDTEEDWELAEMKYKMLNDKKGGNHI